MFRAILIISLLFSIAVSGNDSQTVKDLLESKGFQYKDILYKRDYSVNDTFVNAFADTMLNNPYKLLDSYENIADSILTDSIADRYINAGFPEIIDMYCNDMNSVLRERSKLPFDKAEALVENLPMFFYEESLSYAKKGIVNMRYDAEYDTSSYDADSILTYITQSSGDYSKAVILTNTFIERILTAYSEGLIMPVDTMLESGRLLVGSTGNDEYIEQYDFIIDMGGNDKYMNQCGVVYPYTRRVKFIMDFSGNDLYAAADSFSISYGAVNGASFIYDMAGDDTYRGSMVSLGSAFCGFSLLEDVDGNDSYVSGIFSQGAGFYGTGILKDHSGNDTYIAACFAQGFGFVKGAGALYDMAGDDIYRAGTLFKHEPLLVNDYLSMSQGFGLGLRPRTCGGIGILKDDSGNDIYHSSVFGQGSSYWHSLGILIDKEGNDYYSSAEYAQGSGIHISSGLLCDESGDDMYYSRYGPSQGEGHDYGLGVLIDRKGDDNYTVSGGQGVGLTNSVGIFIDYAGNDRYHNNEKISNGDATLSRSYWGTGIFADMEGNDDYDIAHAGDSISAINHYYSIFNDEPMLFIDSVADTFDIDSLIPIDSLFDIASEWAVRENAEQVEAAREILKQRYEEAFDYIIAEKMTTESGLEMRAITDLLSVCTDSMNMLLLSMADTNDIEVRNNILYMLGEIKFKPAFESFKSHALNDTGRTQLLAVIGLGNTGEGNLGFLEKLLGKNERLSIYVLDAMGKTVTEPGSKVMNLMSEKTSRNIRFAAAEYISDFDNALELSEKMPDIYEKYILIHRYTEKHEDYDIEKVKQLIEQSEKDSYSVIEIKKKIMSVLEDNDD